MVSTARPRERYTVHVGASHHLAGLVASVPSLGPNVGPNPFLSGAHLDRSDGSVSGISLIACDCVETDACRLPSIPSASTIAINSNLPPQSADSNFRSGTTPPGRCALAV